MFKLNKMAIFAIAILAITLISTASFAIIWKGQVRHPRTIELVTKYDKRLDMVKPSKDGKILWVDLAKQRLSVFQNKTFVTSYQILTGKDATPTPTGTYAINYKLMKANDGVRLQDEKGNETARVTYWIPFIDDNFAFHNASWRETWEFGKIKHRQLNGSKGCINMSYSDIADLYNLVNEGTVVYISK
jgi:lipoprotein-anchoring transpeptidase ErfK/SrfK